MISVLRHNNSALTIDLFDPHWRLRNEDLLSIQNQSLEDDATVNDDDARSERTKNTKELKNERRHDLNELCKEFMELGASGGAYVCFREGSLRRREDEAREV